MYEVGYFIPEFRVLICKQMTLNCNRLITDTLAGYNKLQF